MVNVRRVAMIQFVLFVLSIVCATEKVARMDIWLVIFAKKPKRMSRADLPDRRPNRRFDRRPVLPRTRVADD